MRLHLTGLLPGLLGGLLGGLSACCDTRPTTDPGAPAVADGAEPRSAAHDDAPPDPFDPAAFEQLPPTSPTGWRARFPGPGQSFVDYLGTQPRRPASGNDQLYLLPLGELETAMVVDHDYAYIVRTPPTADMVAIVHAFFSLQTHLMETQSLETLVEVERIETGHEQFRAQSILAATAGLLPPDAFSMTSLMVRDVYFDDAQTFGYGFGQHREGQAVVSFARLDPVVSGHRRPDDILQILPLRGFKLLVHEVGHTFGFEHCTEYRCIMNGFADLEELDATPLHLGPVCLRKLVFATEADPVTRYGQLSEAFERAGLGEQAAWASQRAQALRSVAPRQ